MWKTVSIAAAVSALLVLPAFAGAPNDNPSNQGGKSSYVLFNQAKHKGSQNSPAYIHPKKNKFPGDTFHPKKNQFPGDTFHPKKNQFPGDTFHPQTNGG